MQDLVARQEFSRLFDTPRLANRPRTKEHEKREKWKREVISLCWCHYLRGRESTCKRGRPLYRKRISPTPQSTTSSPVQAKIRSSTGGGEIFLLFFVNSSSRIDPDLNLTFSFFRVRAVRNSESVVMKTHGYRRPRQMETYLVEPIHGAWADIIPSPATIPTRLSKGLLYRLRLVLE